MSLNEQVFQLVKSLGADFVGGADLSTAREFICKQGGEHLAAYPFALSIGIRLMDTLVDLLPHWEEQWWVSPAYKYHAYDKVNDRLDAIASRVSSLLQNEGYRALPVPSWGGARPDTLESLFSHKLAAHLAGLGWIGRSGLLITPQAGPRVRWTSVLTTFPVEHHGPMLEDQCGTCTICADNCPVKALKGRNFRPDEPREMRFDYHGCLQNILAREKQTGARICSLCVYGCPHGSRNRASA